jgi:hypothetical protein
LKRRRLQKHGPVLFYGPVLFWRLKRQVSDGGYKTVATCPMAFKTAAVAKDGLVLFYGPVSSGRLKRQVPDGGYKTVL